MKIKFLEPVELIVHTGFCELNEEPSTDFAVFEKGDTAVVEFINTNDQFHTATILFINGVSYGVSQNLFEVIEL